MNRRNFLGTMTAASVVARNFAWAADDHKIEKFGIQLYTLRSIITPSNVDDIMGQLATIGYREVELASDVRASPEQQRESFRRHGLAAVSAHRAYEQLTDKWQGVLDECKTFGVRYVVIPGVSDDVRNRPDGYKIAADTFNKAGAISKKQGIQLCFHNHWAEFVPDAAGNKPFDILLKYGDPQLLKIEMDLGWSSVAGIDPMKYFAKYPGRFPLVHVKDFKKLPDHKTVYSGHFDGDETIANMTAVGSGVIDWKRIFAHSEQAGVKHYFVEHDEPKHPMEVARDSYNYLAKLRF